MTSDPTDWTPEQIHDSLRTAIRDRARAGEHGDGQTVALLWNTAVHQPSLVWLLATLPGMFARSVAASLDTRFANFDAELEALALRSINTPNINIIPNPEEDTEND